MRPHGCAWLKLLISSIWLASSNIFEHCFWNSDTLERHMVIHTICCASSSLSVGIRVGIHPLIWVSWRICSCWRQLTLICNFLHLLHVLDYVFETNFSIQHYCHCDFHTYSVCRSSCGCQAFLVWQSDDPTLMLRRVCAAYRTGFWNLSNCLPRACVRSLKYESTYVCRIRLCSND